MSHAGGEVIDPVVFGLGQRHGAKSSIDMAADGKPHKGLNSKLLV